MRIKECRGCSSRKEKLEEVVPEIHEVAVSNETDEEIYPSDRQEDGSGDGPLNTIPPPTNCITCFNQRFLRSFYEKKFIFQLS